jgi:hypothetical protein
MVVLVVVVTVAVTAANPNHLARQNHHAVAVVVRLRLLIQAMVAEQRSNAFLPEPQVLAERPSATKRRFGVVFVFLAADRILAV